MQRRRCCGAALSSPLPPGEVGAAARGRGAGCWRAGGWRTGAGRTPGWAESRDLEKKENYYDLGMYEESGVG